VDEEPKLGDDAERLTASAFLARYKRFRYIETRSGMNMSDTKPACARGLPIALFVKDVRRAQDSKLVPLQGLSNREHQLLERPLTHRKQTMAPRSNRELSTNQFSCNSRVLVPLYSFSNGSLRSVSGASHLLALTQEGPLATRHSPVLTETASHSRMAVTYRKQTTEKFLTGARIAHLETRQRARMDAQISAKLAAQMKGNR
jgi:hypothetical protein